MVYPDFAKIRIADVPGIIEGASKGVGLGIAFLKHLERSRVLVYVIDMAGTDGREPWNDYQTLAREIAEFNTELPQRPAIVVANKMDRAAARKNLSRFVKETGVTPIALCCAEAKKDLHEYADLKGWKGPLGMDAFRARLREVVKPKAPHEDKPPLGLMPDTTGAEIPAEAMKFATFLHLDPPKRKSHPSRGNIH